MIQQQIKFHIEWLQKENYKSFYLAFLRVAVSLWLLKEVYINWPAVEILFGQSAFVISKNNFTGRLPASISFIESHYRWFLVSYVAIIFLNILGIGRWFTALLLFAMAYVLQKMNMPFINGGDLMVRMILLYLIFANSYEYFVLVKQKYAAGDNIKLTNLLSNLAAFSIMLQLCIAYFSSGLAKISDPVWRQGEAIYYAFSMERFIGTPFNKYIIQYSWLDIIINYSVIFFELLFPLLIWIKKFRIPLLVTGVLFHLAIYIFLMIYGFQIVFILMYGLFLPNERLRSRIRRIIGLH